MSRSDRRMQLIGMACVLVIGPAGAQERLDPPESVKCTTPQARVPAGQGRTEAGVVVRCENLTPFPQTVVLSVKAFRVDDGNPSGETQHVLEPRQWLALRSFRIVERGWRLSFGTRVTLGRPMAEAPQTTHWLPFAPGQAFVVAQIHSGPLSSHNTRYTRYAVDFSVPYGTPVYATRDGVVAIVKSGSTTGGPGEPFRGKENLVMVYHPDSNTWSLFAHLAADIALRSGQAIRAGDQIGRTGESGMLGGPHLHYSVEMRDNERSTTIPFEFRSRNGEPLSMAYGKGHVAQ